MQKNYPGVDLAYELAVDSYEPLISRLDTIDGRLQTIMGFAATTMALVPSVASARNLSFASVAFWVAFAIFVFILAVGSHARHHGEIKLLNPAKFEDYDTWLGYEPWEFKSTFIHWAGQHFEHNNNLVTWKWKRSVIVTFAFFVQVVFLVAWVALARL